MGLQENILHDFCAFLTMLFTLTAAALQAAYLHEELCFVLFFFILSRAVLCFLSLQLATKALGQGQEVLHNKYEQKSGQRHKSGYISEQ